MRTPVTYSQLSSKIFKVLRIPAAVLALAVLYVAVIGIKIDASSHEQGHRRQAHHSARTGSAVHRPPAARNFRHPKLHMGGLHIANARGFGGDEFASLGEARLELDLWLMLWGHLQIEELSGSEVHLRLQTHKNGSNNWAFGQQQRKRPMRISLYLPETIACSRCSTSSAYR